GGLPGRLAVPADVRVDLRALLLDLPLEPGVADEDAVLRAGEVEALLAGEAGEVGDVYRVRDQESVGRELLEVLGEGLPALKDVVHTMVGLLADVGKTGDSPLDGNSNLPGGPRED